MTEFQTIKGVGPYTATIIASHAVGESSALGLDVWSRELLVKRFLGVDDACRGCRVGRRGPLLVKDVARVPPGAGSVRGGLVSVGKRKIRLSTW